MKENSLPSSLLPRAVEALLLLGLILAPLAVVPIFTNFMITSKLLLLFMSAIVLGGIFIWRTFKDRMIEVPHSPLVLGLTLFGVSALISSLLTTQYPMENLLGMGGMYIALAVVAITGGQFLRARNEANFMNVLNISAILLAVSTIVQHFGFGPGSLLNAVLPLQIPAGDSFNLSGSLWIAAQVLGVVTVANIVSLIVRRKTNITQAVALPIVIIGLLFALWGVMPGKPANPVFVPFTLSWSVAIDALKSPRIALIGFGPENYSDAFQLLKPAWVNQTVFWNSSLGQASNLPLAIVPTLGLLGLAAWVFLVIKILIQVPVAVRRHPALVAVILTTLILQVLTTPTLVLSWIQAIALAYLIATREEGKPLTIHLFKITYLDPEMHQDRRHLATFLSWGVPALIALLVAAALVLPLGKAYAASHYFFRSLVAQQANDLNSMYTNQQLAAQTNRYISGYRSNFALTSLLGAKAIASNQDTAKAHQDEISALIQQGINEGRAAAALRPLDSQTWYVLGQVYGSIVGTTPDALQWAVAAYTQAIQTNPTSPMLRLELGTLLYGQKQYEDAAALFQQAYQLKPDLTNASYNLATTYRQLGQYQKAQLAYQAALSTLKPDSDDYKQVKSELDSLPKDAQSDSSAKGQSEATNTTKAVASPTPSPKTTSATQQNVTTPEEAINQASPAPTLPELNRQTSPKPSPSPVVSPSPAP